MNSIYDQIFAGMPFLEPGEYEQCQFKSCALAEADLSGCKFIDCDFVDCDLSLAKLDQSAWQDVRFKDCKLLGLRFDRVNPFGLALAFTGCRLNHSSFFRLKLKNTRFTACQMQEVDCVEADFTGAMFDDCDLLGAIFDRTLLERADLRQAWNYQLDPDQNEIKGAKCALEGLPGLLSKYQLQIES